jgi:hypothetical protein
MVTIKTKRGRVEVADKRCGPALACFVVNDDKGTFVPGRGYTSYYVHPHLVCWTRHCNGCPPVAVCSTCHRVLAIYTGGICPDCSQLIGREG